MEVGRQLGELETSQHSVQASLESSISQLVAAANEMSAPSCAPSPPVHGGTLSELSNTQQHPTSPTGREGSAGRRQSEAPARSGSKKGGDFLSRPSSRGLLPTTIYATSDAVSAAEPDPFRYAFQPRRQVVLTPGEQQLAARSRPSSGCTSRGNLHSMKSSHSSSAAGLLLGASPIVASCPR